MLLIPWVWPRGGMAPGPRMIQPNPSFAIEILERVGHIRRYHESHCFKKWLNLPKWSKWSTKNSRLKVGKLFPYIDSLTLWDRFIGLSLETDLISPPNPLHHRKIHTTKLSREPDGWHGRSRFSCLDHKVLRYFSWAMPNLKPNLVLWQWFFTWGFRDWGPGGIWNIWWCSGSCYSFLPEECWM